MKPSIDEQIEAVTFAHEMLRHDGRFPAKHYENMKDAMRTLLWLKANPEIAKLVYSITKEFPGARVKQREEE